MKPSAANRTRTFQFTYEDSEDTHTSVLLRLSSHRHFNPRSQRQGGGRGEGEVRDNTMNLTQSGGDEVVGKRRGWSIGNDCGP